jgi:hypothetical protein
VCAWEVSGPKVVLLSSCFRGGVGSKILLEQFSSNFSFQNKLTFVLLFDLLVSNNTFLKCLTGYTDDDGYENGNAYVLMIIKTKAMKSFKFT